MVAVQADQGLPSGIGQRAPGIGPDGRVVVVQTKLPLRHGDRLTYRRWDADFNNCASKGQLNGLLANRAVRARRRRHKGIDAHHRQPPRLVPGVHPLLLVVDEVALQLHQDIVMARAGHGRPLERRRRRNAWRSICGY